MANETRLLLRVEKLVPKDQEMVLVIGALQLLNLLRGACPSRVKLDHFDTEHRGQRPEFKIPSVVSR